MGIIMGIVVLLGYFAGSVFWGGKKIFLVFFWVNLFFYSILLDKINL